MKSPDGDQRYPGEIDASACYSLNDDNELRIMLKAVAKDKPTIVNMTSHPYFNLSGTGKVCKISGSCFGYTANTRVMRILDLINLIICPLEFLTNLFMSSSKTIVSRVNRCL